MYIPRSRRLGIAMPFADHGGRPLVGIAQAHVLKNFGPYTVALGWAHEPTYVGELNAVQVVVTDAGQAGHRHRGMATSRSSSASAARTPSPLELSPTYDEDTGLGTPGDYEAPIVPTAPGDYTFHLTGKIHDQAVDETATSSDSTFDSAVETTGDPVPGQAPVAHRADDASSTGSTRGSRQPVAAPPTAAPHRA